ncbi:efflux transporter outer membrane subunit [Novosphingobium sp. NBM11]|uniref:efflux transporter outer membrane subunit n=1 Tax=Novosphingobium sp. NBM11 TaxID=2596914 RepID=UPI0018927A09|nr:efflux transporter outer membrane subunit [Novosphingobium sp. NBM11]MBF5089924.1 efflux transporter outer membrane subunit [Novosphingobium sp. NBM11]
MNRRLLFATLPLAAPMAILAGCNMAPKYIRPEAPVAPALPQGESYPVLAAGETRIDEIGWRDFFLDDRLRQVIALSLANNRDLRVAVANVEQAQALYRVQRAALFPTIAATATGSEARTNGLTVDTLSTGIGISSFTLDLFGRQRNLTQAQFQTFLATDEGRKATQITLVAEVATAWLTYAANADLLRVAEETLQSREQSLALTQRREAMGIGTRLDIAQAQTALQTARSDVADYKTRLAQARNALELLAGAPVSEAMLADTLGNGGQTLATLPVNLSSAVLLKRPDVLGAEHRLHAAYANIGAARAAWFPTISLTAALGVASGSLSGLFNSGDFRWNASGNASETVFDAGARSGNLASAKAARTAAVATYEKAIQTAFSEVANALARRGTIDDKLAAQLALTDNAGRALTLSQSRYRNGIDTYLTTLDAQRTLYTARLSLVNTRLAAASNMVELYRSLGGGLNAEPARP